MNCDLCIKRMAFAFAFVGAALTSSGCRMHRDPQQELARRCANISNDGILWAEADMGVYPLVE